MAGELLVHGELAPGFEGLGDAFRLNFERHGEVGASLAVYMGGAPVVDLWGGLADPAQGTAWGRDTATLIYSATKGASAVCVHLLAERGELDLGAAVADYWPEFGAAGKDAITVVQLLSHQAGLAVPTEQLSRADLLAGTPVVQALERQRPLWEPGTTHGYHALTFGWLVGELVHRVTGRTLGTYFAEEITDPLGLDFWIGLPAEHQGAVAPLIDGVFDTGTLDAITDPQVQEFAFKVLAALIDPTSLLARVLSTNGVLPTPDATGWNDPAVRAAEIPAANGITNARSLARLYAACVAEVDGIRLLTEQTVSTARAQQVHGADAVTLDERRYGIGFQLANRRFPMLGESSFGHAGAGGALGFADVHHRLGFGYVQNRLGASLVGDPRSANLIGALRRALGYPAA